MPSSIVAGNFAANVYPVTIGNAAVSQFVTPAQSQGPVAICLSGGGSRALTAALGQLQALELVTSGGVSLLSKARAISTVSGGSWIGVPFVYLQNQTDQSFLGTYTPPDQLTSAGIDSLSSGFASNITAHFSVPALAVQALLLHHNGVPADMLWQTLIGLHLLAPCGLFAQQPSPPPAPASFFSYNAATVTGILNQTFPNSGSANASLKQEPANAVAAGGQPRPYLVCNMAMFVTTPSGEQLLAPVQSTPILTGIIGTPDAKDDNGFSVGGGGVQSFGFNSTPQQVAANNVLINQSRQWSLVDAVGTSSAAFAGPIEEKFAEWRANPAQFQADLAAHGPHAAAFLQLGAADLAESSALLPDLGGLTDLVPEYIYWPVANVPAGQNLRTSDFADGGNLENSGIAAMLAYSDVSTIVAFLNSSTKMQPGVNSTIQLDSMIPPLFGYQPYDNGYVTYAAGSAPFKHPYFQNSQVFPSDAFQDLYQGLWTASGSGSYSAPAIYKQTLTTVQNDWFGVGGGRSVTVIWVYLEFVESWYNAITDPLVRARVDALKLFSSFPHYSTLKTELDAAEINLLANLTAWVVMNNLSF